MFNIVFEEEYAAATELLVRMRCAAGLSQRDLAKRLGRSQGHVHRMETRQRSIELVEFCRIARACGLDPRQMLSELIETWDRAGHGYASAQTRREAAE